ncbi:hypothetical protein EDD85DRAFT_1024839 [Armillaria nabsnona]|nr:hypothetical protein EDD85DRAFT_1024839 [Armillaria nabsnona]
MPSSTITQLLLPKRTTAFTDTMLGTATGSQGGYMRSVSTSATSVHVYIVALGWLVVPELFCALSRYNLVWGDLGRPLNFYQHLFRDFCHFCIANGAALRVYYHPKYLTDISIARQRRQIGMFGIFLGVPCNYTV